MPEKIEDDMDDNFTSIHPCHCTGTSLSCLAKEDNGGASATIEKPAKKYRTRETQTNNHNGAAATIEKPAKKYRTRRETQTNSHNGAAATMEKPVKKYRTRETQTNNHNDAAATIEKPAKKYRTRETQTNNHNGDSPANIRHWLYLHKVAIVAYLVFLLLFLFRFHTLAVHSTFLFSVFSTTCRSWPTLIVGWDFLLPKNLHVFVKFCVANCVFTRAYLLLALDAIPRMEWNKVSFEFMIVILLFLVEHLEMIRRYKNRLHELSNREPKAPSGKDPSAGGLLLPDKPAASPSAQRSTQSAATT